MGLGGRAEHKIVRQVPPNTWTWSGAAESGQDRLLLRQAPRDPGAQRRCATGARPAGPGASRLPAFATPIKRTWLRIVHGCVLTGRTHGSAVAAVTI
jgi:hypothetical protein